MSSVLRSAEPPCQLQQQEVLLVSDLRVVKSMSVFSLIGSAIAIHIEKEMSIRALCLDAVEMSIRALRLDALMSLCTGQKATSCLDLPRSRQMATLVDEVSKVVDI
jgi:hypothetical protein